MATLTNKGNNSRSKRTKREALLSEAQRKKIRSREMSSSEKSDIYRNLDEKLPALLDDLNIIAKSKTLDTWRKLKKYQFRSDFSKLAKIFEDIAGSEFTKIYLDRIRWGKNSKGKKVFWLEISPSDKILDRMWKKKKPYYSEKIFRPENILTGSKETKKTKELLMEAYYLKLLPFHKKEGLERKKIQKILESKKKKVSKKSPKCKTCGFRYSPKCPVCRERFHNKFKDIMKDTRLNEYLMVQKINTKDYNC